MPESGKSDSEWITVVKRVCKACDESIEATPYVVNDWHRDHYVIKGPDHDSFTDVSREVEVTHSVGKTIVRARALFERQ